MKNILFKTGPIFFLFPFAMMVGTQAYAGQTSFWDDVQTLVKKCSVRPFTFQDGQKVYGHLKSVCPEVQVKGSEATFQLDNEWFTAELSDSPDADGGDLNDVTVLNSSGMTCAELRNIPAFGDVLLGLAGGRVVFPERYVPAFNSPNL